MEIKLAATAVPFFEGVRIEVEGVDVLVCPKWEHIAENRTAVVCYEEGARVDSLMLEIAAEAEDCGTVLYTRDPRFLLVGLRYLLFESRGRQGDDMKSFNGDREKSGAQYRTLRSEEDSEIWKWL